MLTTLDMGLHHAVLDLASGDGFLILPLPRTDVVLDGESLHRADFLAALEELDFRGWSLSERDPDGIARTYQGFTYDGRALVSLYGQDPLLPDLAFAARIDAWTAIKRVARDHRTPYLRDGQDSF